MILPALGLEPRLASAADPDPGVEPVRKLSLQPLEQREPLPADASPPPARRHAEQRPFAYLLDPSTPSAGDVPVEYVLGFGSGVSADRPLPAALLSSAGAGSFSGPAHSLTVGYGLTDRLAPFASARLVQPGGPDEKTGGGGSVGLRAQLTDPASTTFHLTLAGAALREVGGSMGTYARVAASYDFGRMRVAGNVHAEHIFEAGRDPLDVLVLGGVSYRTFEQLRVGLEYVGQDIEEAVAHNSAEGGARHYAGPTVAVDLEEGRLQLVAGPAFSLTETSHRMVGRAGIMLTF